MATKLPRLQVPVKRMPIGVYTSNSRESAIVVKQTDSGVWYLTMKRGWIQCVHAGDENFAREFPLALPDYPVRRAVKMYDTSGLRREENTQKVMTRILERM